MKKTILLGIVCLLGVAATVTNGYIEKPFSVANTNTNAGTATLVGTATVVYANSPFSISSNAVFAVPSGRTQDVIIRFDTSKIGRFTNYVRFTSNGGNLTNLVTGTVTPAGLVNFRIQ